MYPVASVRDSYVREEEEYDSIDWESSSAVMSFSSYGSRASLCVYVVMCVCVCVCRIWFD